MHGAEDGFGGTVFVEEILLPRELGKTCGGSHWRATYEAQLRILPQKHLSLHKDSPRRKPIVLRLKIPALKSSMGIHTQFRS